MSRPKNYSREEVLEQAMPLFWTRGFADTGLHDLEKATGVNKSGLYSEFKNKEDLFLAALQHYSDGVKSADWLLAEPLGWHNIEKYLIDYQTTKAQVKGCFCVNSMRELAVLPSEAQKIVIESRTRLRRMLLKNIEAEKTKMPATQLVEIVSTFFSGVYIEQNIRLPTATAVQKIRDFIKLMRSA